MRTIKVTTKTQEQIAADFAAAFDHLTPDGPTGRPTQQQRLEPYRAHIMKRRKQGFSWKLIAAGMREQPINEKVTEKLLKAVFEPKKVDPKQVDPTPAQPRPARLILDRATGRPIPLDPATNLPFAPVPPQQSGK